MTARVTEAAQINDYAESFWQGNSKMDFICLVEDRGNVVKTPDKKAIVKNFILIAAYLHKFKRTAWIYMFLVI